jgi:drug/metabolite transporter (DMT)-like permease
MAARAYLYLTITTAGWGGNAVAGKLAVGHVSPAMLTSLRWAAALMIILPFALPHLRREWAVIKAHAAILLFLGIVGFALFNNLLYLALIHTSAINAAIEQAATPLVIFIASYALFGQRATASQLLGFMISVVGVALVASHGDLTRLLDLDVGFGDAMLLLAVFCYGIYTVSLRWKPKLHWLSLMTTLGGAAFIGSVPFTIWEGFSGDLRAPDLHGWLVVLYAATIPSIICQALYIKGNELIGGNRAGLFFNLVPIFGTFLAVVLLDEAFRIYHMIALALVLGGIAMAERRRGAVQI